jgi:hypothetical protein
MGPLECDRCQAGRLHGLENPRQLRGHAQAAHRMSCGLVLNLRVGWAGGLLRQRAGEQGN